MLFLAWNIDWLYTCIKIIISGWLIWKLLVTQLVIVIFIWHKSAISFEIWLQIHSNARHWHNSPISSQFQFTCFENFYKDVICVRLCQFFNWRLYKRNLFKKRYHIHLHIYIYIYIYIYLFIYIHTHKLVMSSYILCWHHQWLRCRKTCWCVSGGRRPVRTLKIGTVVGSGESSHRTTSFCVKSTQACFRMPSVSSCLAAPPLCRRRYTGHTEANWRCGFSSSWLYSHQAQCSMVFTGVSDSPRHAEACVLHRLVPGS